MTRQVSVLDYVQKGGGALNSVLIVCEILQFEFVHLESHCTVTSCVTVIELPFRLHTPGTII